MTQSKLTESTAADHSLFSWENGEVQRLPFKDFLGALRTFDREDVFIKGANAVNPFGLAGGPQTNPNGGSWAGAFGAATARGLRTIVPVGLEKVIPSVVDRGAPTFWPLCETLCRAHTHQVNIQSFHGKLS